MRRALTISTRFGILLAGLLPLLMAGCGAAFWGQTTARSEGKSAAESSEKGEKQGAHDKDKSGSKEDEKKDDGEKKDEKEEEKIPGHVNVRCVTARRIPFAITVDGLGRTEPLPDCVGSLTAAVEGHVRKLLVKLGDSVKARQPILELDQTVAKAALAEKEANRDSLIAALKLLQSLPRPVETQAAELAVEQAKIAVDHDQALIDRLRPLLPDHAVSPAVFHDAEVALKQAQVQQRTAEAQLKLLMAGPRKEAVDEAQTRIAMADQAVASARETLALHTLCAPIAGVVESLNCHPGQTLTIGTPVGEVIDIRQLFVTVYFPARITRLLQPGMVARVDLSDGSPSAAESSAKETVSGKVSFIGSAADPQTGNYAVRILMDNSGTRLRLGQVVKATIVLRKEEPQLAVPDSAIFDQGEGPLLAVVREGKIKLLHPELGAREGDNVAVSKTDLKEGEPVVIEGAYGVPDDTEATILPEAPTATSSPESKGPGESKEAPAGESKGAATESKDAESKAAAKGGGHE